jgi:hypothetical protein
MPFGTTRRWRALAVIGCSTAVGAAAIGIAPALSQAPSPPVNDAYLQSLRLNDPGTKLNRTATLEDKRDTSAATVQADIFNPPQSGGPAETTVCAGAQYGKTVWYDFYPDADGLVRIRTSGFDNVITVYRFDRSSLVPDVASRQCTHQSSFPSEELLAQVKGGEAYTIQVGGVNGAGGALDFLFDYIPNPPHRLSADATLKAQATSNGIKVLGLSVSAPRGARVRVRCSRGCPTQAKTARSVSFSRLRGTQLSAGAKLQIFVTEPKAIGALIQYDIKRGNFGKTTSCLEPGSLKPQRSCH